jgi:hypothetical protein
MKSSDQANFAVIPPSTRSSLPVTYLAFASRSDSTPVARMARSTEKERARHILKCMIKIPAPNYAALQA